MFGAVCLATLADKTAKRTNAEKSLTEIALLATFTLSPGQFRFVT